MGISALSGLTVTGGTVTGSATGAEGVGISAFTGMTVSGGTVTGGSEEGDGVYVGESLTVNYGAVRGESAADNSEDTYYSGIYVAKDMKVTGGEVTGESGGRLGLGVYVEGGLTA